MLKFTSSLRNQRESPLMRLPAELRDSVFKYLLGGQELRIMVYEDPLLASRPMGDTGHFKDTKNFVTITQTCRQAHSDTKLMPFGLNKIVGNAVDLSTFMDDAAAWQIKAIETVRYTPLYHKSYLGENRG